MLGIIAYIYEIHIKAQNKCSDPSRIIYDSSGVHRIKNVSWAIKWSLPVPGEMNRATSLEEQDLWLRDRSQSFRKCDSVTGVGLWAFKGHEGCQELNYPVPTFKVFHCLMFNPLQSTSLNTDLI